MSTHPFGHDVELRRGILTFLGDQALPRIVSLTMPVFAPGERHLPELVASAIMLEVGPARLLVSATHVVEGGEQRGLAINIGDELVPIRGRALVVHSEGAVPGSAADHLDTVVLRLDGDVGSRVHQSNVVTTSDLDLTAPHVGRDPFLMVGYPCSRNRDGLDGDTFEAHAYPLLLHDGDADFYQLLGARADSQLAVPFDKKDVWTVDSKVTAPDLYGVSGGGLWRVPIHDEAPVRDTRLTAIAVEWHPRSRHKHVLSTRMRPLLVALHEAYPDLQQAIETAFASVA